MKTDTPTTAYLAYLAAYPEVAAWRDPDGICEPGAEGLREIAGGNLYCAVDAWQELGHHTYEGYPRRHDAEWVADQAIASYRENVADTVREKGGTPACVAFALAFYDQITPTHRPQLVDDVQEWVDTVAAEADGDEPLCDDCGSTDGDVRDVDGEALCGACGGHGEPHEPYEPAGEDKARAYLAETQGVDVLDDGTPVEAISDVDDD